VVLYNAWDALVTNVVSFVAGAPAVVVTDGIVVGLVVISLAIEVGADVGAKIVSALGATENCLIFLPEANEHWPQVSS
jgi:hypothetical protein